MIKNTGRKALIGSVAALTSLGLLAPAAVAAPAHCDDHRTEAKVEADSGSSATIQVPNAVTGELVDVTVVIDGSSISLEGEGLASANWCIKTARSSTDGSGLSGSSEIYNKKGVEQDVSYVVVYDVSTGRTGGRPS